VLRNFGFFPQEGGRSETEKFAGPQTNKGLFTLIFLSVSLSLSLSLSLSIYLSIHLFLSSIFSFFLFICHGVWRENFEVFRSLLSRSPSLFLFSSSLILFFICCIFLSLFFLHFFSVPRSNSITTL
jgi:lysylphosphatidylglycerol synthetase-like protein (DUF2156 family)